MFPFCPVVTSRVRCLSPLSALSRWRKGVNTVVAEPRAGSRQDVGAVDVALEVFCSGGYPGWPCRLNLAYVVLETGFECAVRE